MDIITKIEKANLIGRGGGCFPTAKKWKMVKDAKAGRKFVVCNASEGEPGIKKDGYLLEEYPEQVIAGMVLAMEYLGAERAYIFLNHKYYKKNASKLKTIIGDKKINIFMKPVSSGYVCGEETTLLNVIEGEREIPRLRPPFPTTDGLWGYPTLINNVETFYNVSLVNEDKFKNERLYTINGDCLHTGVYSFADNLTIDAILRKTNNYPGFDFFVQAGGDGSGEILNSKQLKKPVSGAGSITIYSIIKHKPIDLIKRWLGFFMDESCGNCTPCREGTLRLYETVSSANPDWGLVSDLLANLDETAFCGLGCAVSNPIRSYINNVLSQLPDNKIQLKNLDNKMICECFR